jgi:hypothetical protein
MMALHTHLDLSPPPEMLLVRGCSAEMVEGDRGRGPHAQIPPQPVDEAPARRSSGRHKIPPRASLLVSAPEMRELGNLPVCDVPLASPPASAKLLEGRWASEWPSPSDMSCRATYATRRR